MASTTSDSSDKPQATRPQKKPSSSFFDVPAPIKQLFDKFPLLSYPVNDLPHRAPRHRNTNVLYLFTTEEGASEGAPSYNPACLKWQVSTKFDLLWLNPTNGLR
jgi:metaxin